MHAQIVCPVYGFAHIAERLSFSKFSPLPTFFYFSYFYVHLSNFWALIWVYLRWGFAHFGISATATSTNCLSFYSYRNTTFLLYTLFSFGHFRDEYSILGQSYGCFGAGVKSKITFVTFSYSRTTYLVYNLLWSCNFILFWVGWWVAGLADNITNSAPTKVGVGAGAELGNI